MSSPSADPFWGAATSNLNFCEEDYTVTRYIAEFTNTLSSLTFVIYGLYGLLHNTNVRRDSARLVSYLGLIGVGLCSAGYHMTLKYHTQMSDELSMHLLTTPLLYRLLSFNASNQGKLILRLILFSLFTIVITTHMMLDEFLLHATSFGLAVLLIALNIMKLIPQQVPDPRIRQRLRATARFGLCSFAIGFGVWLVDEWMCSTLTDLKHVVGFPLAIILELHGWWHVLTAIGGYVAVAIVDAITTIKVHDDPTNQMAWPIPLVTGLMTTPSANGNKRE